MRSKKQAKLAAYMAMLQKFFENDFPLPSAYKTVTYIFNKINNFFQHYLINWLNLVFFLDFCIYMWYIYNIYIICNVLVRRIYVLCLFHSEALDAIWLVIQGFTNIIARVSWLWRASAWKACVNAKGEYRLGLWRHLLMHSIVERSWGPSPFCSLNFGQPLHSLFISFLTTLDFI